MELKERLTAVVEPVLSSMGYELVLLEFATSGRQGLLRVFIDAPAGIALEDCERVSRELSAVLDVENPINEAYRLEISSPGADRPLVKPEHFERFRGETVRIQTWTPIAGKRKFLGILHGLQDDAVSIEVGAERLQVPLAQIERARLVPDYDREWKAR